MRVWGLGLRGGVQKGLLLSGLGILVSGTGLRSLCIRLLYVHVCKSGVVISIYIYTCVYVYIYICISLCMCACGCTSAHKHTHIYRHVYK